ADHDRVGLSRLRLRYFQRTFCAGRNSARDHRAAVKGEPSGAQDAGGARTGAPRRLSNRCWDAGRACRAACVGDSGGQGTRDRMGDQGGGEMSMYRFALATLFCAAVLAPSALGAQTYPSKPIHFILPYVPGGIIDTAGRNLALRLSESLGVSVVPENRPGAGGMV